MSTISEYHEFLMDGVSSIWNSLLYPVELIPQESSSWNVCNRYMVVRTDTRQVLSLVSDKYSLITNAEALDLGKKILEHVYKCTLGNLKPTNIRHNLNSTWFVGSFIPEDYEFELVNNDRWTPFLYIQNSYDKTLPFRCWVGMCRVACLNGLIFTNVNVKISSKHKIDSIKHQIHRKINTNQTDLNFQIQKELYMGVFNRLTKIPIKDEWVRPLVCSALEVSYFNNIKDVSDEIAKINKRYQERESVTKKNKRDYLMILMRIIDNKWECYSESLGKNAYALYNIVSEIATHDPYSLNQLVNIKPSEVKLTIKATQWAKSFAENLEGNTPGVHMQIKDFLVFNEIPADEYYVPH